MGMHQCLIERNIRIERLVIDEHRKQGQVAKLVSREFPEHPITRTGISHLLRREPFCHINSQHTEGNLT
jgi:hypothetical protein